MTGQTLGYYHTVKKLGEGGMGVWPIGRTMTFRPSRMLKKSPGDLLRTKHK